MKESATKSVILPDEQATVNFASQLAGVCPDHVWLYFSGCLGAGKTTLIRALLRKFGITGTIHSPSFTLLEVYQQGEKNFYHLDCYRLSSPQELIEIGIRDVFAEPAVICVEWPEKGQGVLPSPDLQCRLETVDDHRQLTLSSHTTKGSDIIALLTIDVNDI